MILCSSLGTVANAVPVVPNFTQGSMQTSTNTTSTVTETINSIDYRTGWEYTVTGVGVENNGEALNPTVSTDLVEITPSAISGQNLEGDATTATGEGVPPSPPCLLVHPVRKTYQIKNTIKYYKNYINTINRIL